MDYKKTLMWKELSETVDVLPEAWKNNVKTVKALAEAIKKSGKTNFVLVGRGTSDHALMYFKNAVEILTPYTAGVAASSVVTMYNGKINLGNSIVIGCSQSGAGEDVYQYVKRGKEQGAITVAVTNYNDSKVAKEADYHLWCACGEEKSVAATKTFSAEMYVMLMLVCELAGEKALYKNLEDLADILKKDVAAIDAATDKYSDMYKDIKDGFTLSMGITYAISLESALKLQETCYIKMKGYPTSDFYHGPMAMISDDTPVIVYCGKGAGEYHFEDQKKFIDRVKDISNRVLVVTDDERLVKDYKEVNVAYLGETVNEYICMFKFALFAQMLACKISCKIGNNPDSPRALKKVTITK